MKELHNVKFNIYFKFIVLELSVILLMSFLAPYLLNYPPNSEDKIFQGQIEPITHFQQYLLLGGLGIVIYILFLCSLFKDVFKYLKKMKDGITDISQDEIKKVRDDCLSLPKKLIIIQLVSLIIVLLVLFVSMNANIRLCFKFLLVYFAFFIVIAILSGIIIKNDLNKIIISTYSIYKLYTPIKHKSKFNNNLLYNLFPFFLILIISISLLGYSKSCDAIGESHYNYYKLYLNNVPTNNLSLDELKQLLSDVPLMNKNNYYFIYTNNNTYFSNPNGSVSKFFIKYANTYLDKNDGRIYEYYGIEEEGYVKTVTLENGETGYFGFKYSTTNNLLVSFFVGISLASSIIYIFILSIWSKSISTNIIKISDTLTEISNHPSGIDNVQIIPVTSSDEIGELTISFNKIQALTKQNIDSIHNNQNMLMEKERLASLGQLIGGIAHNLKTPIMSISGAAEGLSNLIKEYNQSIEDPQVTIQDHHDIAKDMNIWIDKIKSYTEYMSDVITAVKGQAVNMSDEQNYSFTIDELVKRINILMKHELKSALIELDLSINLDPLITINGNISSLIQVINNMISNSIQAYHGTPNKIIDLIIKEDKNNIIISIKDYADGLPKEVKDKLFKEMITTKGKNGTGLGLFMSYSTIKAHFNGNITFESIEGMGTTFNIILPKNP